MARFTGRLPSPAMLVALVALSVALSGTAIAATGGSFGLGQPNTATSQSALTANEAGKALQITNTIGSSTNYGATSGSSLRVRPAWRNPISVHVHQPEDQGDEPGADASGQRESPRCINVDVA